MSDIIQKSLEFIAGTKVVQDMFDDFDVSLSELFLIPIIFQKNLNVSAQTKHGIIYLNNKLKKEVKELAPYLTHEITHYLQQTTGDKPTQGSGDDDYLENPAEVEGFNNQTEFLSETEGNDKADKYIDQVLDHHDINDLEERKDKKEDLLQVSKPTKE